MIFFKRYFSFIFREGRSVFWVIYCLCMRMLKPNGVILLTFMENGNWGDELNYHFFSTFTKLKVLRYPNTYVARFFAVRNLVSIGSILCNYPNRSSIVWGSGVGNDKIDLRLRCRPQKILAVRGPLTRKWLESQGVSCPNVFGDPALLLPRFYTPKLLPRKRIGVIPHVVDWQYAKSKICDAQGGDSDIRLISMDNYNDWRDVIDEICSCDCVFSGSLHGLIVAEAYGVPSVWVKFREMKPGWDFKFFDFYKSIGRSVKSACYIECREDITRMASACLSTWSAAEIKTDDLYNSAPFSFSITE